MTQLQCHLEEHRMGLLISIFSNIQKIHMEFCNSEELS